MYVSDQWRQFFAKGIVGKVNIRFVKATEGTVCTCIASYSSSPKLRYLQKSLKLCL